MTITSIWKRKHKAQSGKTNPPNEDSLSLLTAKGVQLDEYGKELNTPRGVHTERHMRYTSHEMQEDEDYRGDLLKELIGEVNKPHPMVTAGSLLWREHLDWCAEMLFGKVAIQAHTYRGLSDSRLHTLLSKVVQTELIRRVSSHTWNVL